LRKYMAGSPGADSISVRTDSVKSPAKSSKIGELRGTTLSYPRTLAHNHINNLRATHMR